MSTYQSINMANFGAEKSERQTLERQAMSRALNFQILNPSFAASAPTSRVLEHQQGREKGGKP